MQFGVKITIMIGWCLSSGKSWIYYCFLHALIHGRCSRKSPLFQWTARVSAMRSLTTGVEGTTTAGEATGTTGPTTNSTTATRPRRYGGPLVLVQSRFPWIDTSAKTIKILVFFAEKLDSKTLINRTCLDLLLQKVEFGVIKNLVRRERTVAKYNSQHLN